jgi:membrane-associated protease RseP (regulator of RpoE activity)
MRTGTTLALAVFVSAWGGSLAAQQPPTAAARPTARQCPDSTQAVGDLGYTRLSCKCTLYFDPAAPERQRWDFGSEPVIEAVRPGGPADGKLEPGDVVVAIDGRLITTREGGTRFAQLTPGEPVKLTVRRDGRELTVEITPDADCSASTDVTGTGVEVVPTPTPPHPARPPRPEVPSRAPRVVTLPPTPPEAPTPALAPLPPVARLLPSGWFGFSIQCSRCGFSYSDRDSTPVWNFSSPPNVESVEPGSPADEAGVREGDRITQIDGRAITTKEAGARFGAIRPGQRVTFGIQRDGETRHITITAGERVVRPARAPAPRPERDVRPTPQPNAQRFSGVLGDALIEVTGGPITVQRTDDEIVIRSADITVRIRRTGSQDH